MAIVNKDATKNRLAADWYMLGPLALLFLQITRTQFREGHLAGFSRLFSMPLFPWRGLGEIRFCVNSED
jgi:hypothetical protein